MRGHSQGRGTRIPVLHPWEMLGTGSCCDASQEPPKPCPKVARRNLVREGQGDSLWQE